MLNRESFDHYNAEDYYCGKVCFFRISRSDKIIAGVSAKHLNNISKKAGKFSLIIVPVSV